MLGEEFIAPEAVVAQLPAAAKAFVLRDAQAFAHGLGPALVQGAVDRVPSAAVEHDKQGLLEQRANGTAGHRTTGIDVSQLQVDFTAFAAIGEEITGTASVGATAVSRPCSFYIA